MMTYQCFEAIHPCLNGNDRVSMLEETTGKKRNKLYVAKDIIKLLDKS